MKRKKGNKGAIQRLTNEEKEELYEKRQEKLQQEFERKENEKYEKYINELRQQNYRAALLNDALKSIDAMRRAHFQHRRSEFAAQKWNTYVSCSSLPNINDPPAVREFIYRWKREIDEDIKNNCSWVLDVDEKTLLSQDYMQTNQCFWNLFHKQPPIGNHYIPRIDQCLILLSEVEIALLNSSEPALNDIKMALRTQLREVLYQFTFRILTNVERDMNRIDARAAKHNFKSPNFSSSIWTSRPVPQIIKPWRTGAKTEIQFPEINALISINDHIEIDGFSYQGILMNYDHFSDMAPSYFLNVKFPSTPDLRTANDNEWKKREEIMHGKLENMKAERARWEKKEEERLAKEAEASKIRGPHPKKEAKTQRVRKPKPGPMEVTERTVVDVTEDFLKYENDLIMQQKVSMGPESLNLFENDINLREFRIVGGVYSLNYFKRPKQYTQFKSQFLYKLDTRHVLKHANFVAYNEIDLIDVEIKLAENVNWWFAPTICYWQPWEESAEFLSLSPEIQEFHKNFDTYVEQLGRLLFTEPQQKLNYNIVKCISDFQLNTLPRDIDLCQLIEQYIGPRMPITYKFQLELDAINEKLRKAALRTKEIEMEKSETRAKRRSEFQSEMDHYFVKVQEKIAENITRMESEFEDYYVLQRARLINLGEHELQIERFLKHKKELNEKKLCDFENDEMAQYRDYVEDQFRERVLSVEMTDKTEDEKVLSKVEKTSPRELYLTKPRQMPLKVIDRDTIYNFDVPNENNPPGYHGEVSDNLLLSTFFRYLIALNEKNQPILRDKPTEEKQLSVVFEVLPQSSFVKRTLSDVVKKPKSPKKSRNKSKSSSKPTKKIKSPKKPPKKSASSKKDGKLAKKKSNANKAASKRSRKAKTPILIETEPSQTQIETILETPRGRARIKKASKNKMLQLIPHFSGKWVRDGATLVDFDPETRIIKFKISRFGTFGFAMPKYCNLPLNYWELYPNATKKHSVMLKIIGKYAEIKIEINEDGYLVERIVPNNINFEPHKTVMNYRDLKIFLQQCHFNIFPDLDAGIYVEDVSEKHRSMEEHTYYCLGQFPLSHYFRMSAFNRLSDRRTAIFEMYEIIENAPEKFVQILVTPQNCNIVEGSEVTTKTGDNYIDFKMVPAEQEYYPDLYNLVLANCNELSVRYHDQMKRIHRFNVARLLCSIRPLSFA